jgi:phosphate transport system substrate-binding protein
MERKVKKFAPFFVLYALIVLISGVWAQEATPETTEAPIETIKLPRVDPIDISGDIMIAGSSTVFPLTERMKKLFEDDGYSDEISDESTGTGAGFERFCVSGDTDINNASRAIRDEEIAKCETIGRVPVEFRVGTDALVVVVSTENDFLQDATLEELAMIFGSAINWSDVRPEYPNEPIERFIPGTESGTFDYFVESVFDDEPEQILGASAVQLSEDDNVLVRGVESSPYAVGFFGFAYYLKNIELLKAISIESVIADEDTAESGEYPLSRPLFIYSDATILQEKPQVAAFINFYLTNVSDEILEVGYFPASVEALNEAKQNWLDATGA